MDDRPDSAQRSRRRPHQVGTPADPRFSFANERTFLAWNRTALALIGGGLAAGQLLRSAVGSTNLIVGLSLIALGAAAGATGFVRWRSSEIALRLRRPLPGSRIGPAILSFGSGGLAVLAIILIVVGAVHA
jgi:putative membrane protein